MKMHKIAVIGDLSSVIGFRGLGMTVIATDDADYALAELDRLVDEEYAIVYVTEPLVQAEPNLIEKYREEISPAVIIIPSGGEFADIGMSNLRQQVKKAVGMDLLKEGQ